MNPFKFVVYHPPGIGAGRITGDLFKDSGKSVGAGIGIFHGSIQYLHLVNTDIFCRKTDPPVDEVFLYLIACYGKEQAVKIRHRHVGFLRRILRFDIVFQIMLQKINSFLDPLIIIHLFFLPLS